MNEPMMDHLPELPEELRKAQPPHFDAALENKSLNSAFLQMGAGLLVTAATSFIFYATGLYALFFQIPMLALILMIGQLGIAVAFGAAMNKASVATMRAMFYGYAVLTGITFSSLAAVYTGSTLFTAFLISSVYFFCLAFVGMTTKRDMSKIGTFCLVALIALLVSQLLMMLFGTPMSVRLYSILGLLIFTGITVWDVSRMKKILALNFEDGVTAQKLSTFFALQLYLDFVNIFLYVLRLVAAGSGSSSRR